MELRTPFFIVTDTKGNLKWAAQDHSTVESFLHRLGFVEVYTGRWMRSGKTVDIEYEVSQVTEEYILRP